MIQTVKSHGDGPVCQKTVINQNATNHAYAMVHGALITITTMETGMILLMFIFMFSCNKNCRVELGYRCSAILMSDSDAAISTFSCVSTSSTTTTATTTAATTTAPDIIVTTSAPINVVTTETTT